ncbi:hypothetical protein NTE_01181 [Candidatus Nitrososphaera evergladensis SR1]|uniref:Uncharacterized protein n=1 Tax=Candidatus Nitrososphaera evergladensis SR1 TaxID=1459636 RepID=A0A075MVG6_9ARCH|nr:hypothetical protein NTE_01181 [Candidatus Nitrososphaera evergladensis SR1]
MAVIIIVKTILALLAIGVASFTLTPVMYSLKENPSLWTHCSSQCLQIRDNLYNIYFYIPVALVGVVVLFAIMSASRRAPDEVA